jgi:preprotein translocase subunit SecE
MPVVGEPTPHNLRNRDAKQKATEMESPFKFAQEVRSETNKVTWPSRRETMITTIMVFVMVGLASIFFFFADQLIRLVVTTILRIHT